MNTRADEQSGSDKSKTQLTEQISQITITETVQTMEWDPVKWMGII
ncbi:hypothetical protein pipiens_012826, partial [Culex pipiens pipiens]